MFGMTVVWRFLVLMALLFWQGGFLFYAAVVVPIGQQELGHRQQGFVTRRVTNYLNLSGAAALGILGIDAAFADRARGRRLARTLSWLAMAATLGWLAWLHLSMEAFLDLDTLGIRKPALFHGQHRLYLWVSALQWACGLVFLLLTLAAWRAADRGSIESIVRKDSIEEEKTEVETKG
jgi:hypothetical protein